tara:strand:+ start:152 stop:784 length:633 start_codon:yes stop_codon:yes gene_type:complete
MERKILIQILLTILLFFIGYIILNYFYISDNSVKKIKSIEFEEKKIEDSPIDKNLIENIEYSFNNSQGDVYQILADYGEINSKNSDLMFLTNVNASLTLVNNTIIILTSDFANFNTQSFETTFINNVKVKRNEEIITGDELYLVLDKEKKKIDVNTKIEENIIRVSNNVIYKKPGYNLKADILELDLITKNIKIYMIDKQKKVLAKSIIK